MAKKTTSNTFTVSTVEDGESAPYYFQEWFAWSNDTSTASVTTSPTIDGSWQTSIPNKGSYAYLWRKSIRFVWNEDTRTYSQESAQYFRMSGTDGTSIKTRGSVADASKRSSSGTATLTNGSTITMSDGDAVTQLDDGHLYQWVTESGGSWIDLGQFKGENGKTYFTHIVYATNVNYSGSSVTSIEGYTPTKSPNDTTHFWMGTYVDETSDDPISGSDPILLSYTWSYTKGNNGKDADFYTLVSRTTNVVKSSSSNPTYTPTSFYLRISHTVGNTTTQSAFVPSGYSVKYMKQSEDVWTTITLVNGAIPVQSSSSYFSDESFCDFALFNGDTIVSLITITRANDGAQGEKGEQGKIGRFFYYAGIFNQNNTSDTFVVSDVQAPYFRDSASASTYHVYNGTNGTYTMSQMWANSSRSFNNAPFESMTTQYKYIITEAVFSSNAHLGSFIVSGDWLISQYGTFYDSDGAVHTINADTVPFYTNAGEDLITKDMAFTWFDAEYPTSYAGGDGNFCPAFAVDGLTGKTYQQEAYISGVFKIGDSSTSMTIDASGWLQFLGSTGSIESGFIMKPNSKLGVTMSGNGYQVDTSGNIGRDSSFYLDANCIETYSGGNSLRSALGIGGVYNGLFVSSPSTQISTLPGGRSNSNLITLITNLPNSPYVHVTPQGVEMYSSTGGRFEITPSGFKPDQTADDPQNTGHVKILNASGTDYVYLLFKGGIMVGVDTTKPQTGSTYGYCLNG